MCSTEPAFQRRVPQGFTLLEIVLAMFVFSLLVASIFGIVAGTTQLADEMSRGHERDAQAHSFAQLCERTLRQLPAQAAVRVKVKEAGHQYLSQFAILNAPSVLGSGAGGGNGLTIFETFQQPDGYFAVRVKLIAADDVAAYEAGQSDGPGGLVLLNDVARCEWKFFNPLSNQWESDWNAAMSFAALVANQTGPSMSNGALNAASGVVPNGSSTNPANPGAPGTAVTAPNLSQVARPTLVELTLAMRTEASRRFVFWVPPAQIPMGVGQPNAPAGGAPVQTTPVPAPGQ